MNAVVVQNAGQAFARRQRLCRELLWRHPNEDYPRIWSCTRISFSVLDKNGNNVFDDGGPQGTAINAPQRGCGLYERMVRLRAGSLPLNAKL